MLHVLHQYLNLCNVQNKDKTQTELILQVNNTKRLKQIKTDYFYFRGNKPRDWKPTITSILHSLTLNSCCKHSVNTSLCVCVCVCVCVQSLSDDVIVSNERITFCRVEHAAQTPNWSQRQRAGGKKKMWDTKNEKMKKKKRNYRQTKERRGEQNQTRERCFTCSHFCLFKRSCSWLSCRHAGSYTITQHTHKQASVCECVWERESVCTHPAVMLGLCSDWRSAAQQHQHQTAACCMTSPTSDLIGWQWYWAVIGPAGQREGEVEEEEQEQEEEEGDQSSGGSYFRGILLISDRISSESEPH